MEGDRNWKGIGGQGGSRATVVVVCVLAACSSPPSPDGGDSGDGAVVAEDGAVVPGCMEEEHCAEVQIEGRTLFTTRNAAWVVAIDPVLRGSMHIAAAARADVGVCDVAQRCEGLGSGIGITVYDEAGGDEPARGSYPVVLAGTSPPPGTRGAAVLVCPVRCAERHWSTTASTTGWVEVAYDDESAILRFDVELAPGFVDGPPGRLIGGLRAPLCVREMSCLNP